jgi:hypothetical protein
MDHPGSRQTPESPESLESLLARTTRATDTPLVAAWTAADTAATVKKKTYLCPMCKSRRVLKTTLSPYTALNFMRVGVTSLLVTLALWPVWGARGAAVTLPLWMIFEMLHRWRVRFSLQCDKCGFDPVLYLKDVGRAKRVVHEHLSAQLAQMQAQRAALEAEMNTASNQTPASGKDPLTEAKPER